MVTTDSGSADSAPTRVTVAKAHAPAQYGPSVTVSSLSGTAGLSLSSVTICAAVGSPVHRGACDRVGLGLVVMVVGTVVRTGVVV
ncbi:hypothetical protein GCM10009531_16880 [Actinoplanes capillaceus]